MLICPVSLPVNQEVTLKNILKSFSLIPVLLCDFERLMKTCWKCSRCSASVLKKIIMSLIYALA